MIWFLNNWKLCVFLTVLGAAAVFFGLWRHTQTVLNAERAEVATQDKERATETAREKSFNEYNRKRTDAQYRNDLASARRSRVLLDDFEPVPGAASPGSGDDPVACYDRGRLNSELTGVFQRLTERLSGIAGEGEAAAAAYRACAEWARGVGESAPR